MTPTFADWLDVDAKVREISSYLVSLGVTLLCAITPIVIPALSRNPVKPLISFIPKVSTCRASRTVRSGPSVLPKGEVHWIPAFAGMTATLPWRRNDGDFEIRETNDEIRVCPAQKEIPRRTGVFRQHYTSVRCVSTGAWQQPFAAYEWSANGCSAEPRFCRTSADFGSRATARLIESLVAS